MTALFNRFEIEMSDEAVTDCAHSGDCLADVQYWAPIIVRSDRCSVDALRSELEEYGAWDDTELADDQENWLRIVWIAANNIKEELTETE